MLENDDLQKYNGSEVVVTVLDKQMPKEQALEKKISKLEEGRKSAEEQGWISSEKVREMLAI
ncbi:hypothetical protein [Treponema peruense]|uniref:Uncharacterized protein n=1 Tax=Treponema peruense TaxID=2787628 RepID=A0A7T3V5Z1_9SPIR|nr:hypothetical protein [Treponema peruense]QQA02112.1 hypothetical protein IWA51_05925 [Treponema peruense]